VSGGDIMTETPYFITVEEARDITQQTPSFNIH
jgi:hypothetical protein